MSASILVVEDEPAIQELVSFTCSSNGFRVRRADSVSAANEAIRAELPDLVILDWMLPDRAASNCCAPCVARTARARCR